MDLSQSIIVEGWFVIPIADICFFLEPIFLNIVLIALSWLFNMSPGLYSTRPGFGKTGLRGHSTLVIIFPFESTRIALDP